MSNELIVGFYLTGEIGFTVKEKQKVYCKKAKKKNEGELDIKELGANSTWFLTTADMHKFTLSKKLLK